MTLHDNARALLHRLTADPTAEFRDGQWEAIETLVERRARVLVVQRTGWGKSAVYFVATRLLRDAGAGPTVLISPLLALMRSQLVMAERAGVRAVTINSENRDDWDGIEVDIAAGTIDLLLISPERLNNPRFRRDVLPELVSRVGMLVVDEAHCISDWGHDFRPDYRRIARVLRMLPQGVPVLCTTATANDRVVSDIVDQLGDDLEVVRGALSRDSLALEVIDLPEPARRLAWLAGFLAQVEGSGIVYCMTVRDTEQVASWLQSCGIDARAYSGGIDAEVRIERENALLDNSLQVLVATSALGMGFDKPDLAFVVHYQSPGSPIAYYQQVGRAGRALEHAPAVLLRGREDTDIQDYFIDIAFPPREQAEQVVELLASRAEPVGVGEIEANVNVRHSRLEGMLKILEIEGAVERANGKWQRAPAPWSYDQERVDRVTAERRAEQHAMVDYATTTSCRMMFLREQLDDPQAAPCGRCDNCRGEHWSGELDERLVAAAVGHLRHHALTIEPRKRWPNSVVEERGTIAEERRPQPGRALCLSNDAGWGRRVRIARHESTNFGNELLDASVALVHAWEPDPRPEWVTCVPSNHHEIVPDFVARLASALGLPFQPVLSRVSQRPPQTEMENSAQQFRNVHGAFAVTALLPAGPVLLVDDVVDSRWTLTVVIAALVDAGSGPVFPFALALTVSA